MGLEALRQWPRRSLANLFTLRAAAIALLSVLLVAGVSVAILLWTEHRAVEAQLKHDAQIAVARVEEPLRVVAGTLADLARSPMFVTALLDSGGRSAYARPFLQNYHFPLAAANGLALCDLNGQLLAGTEQLADCGTDRPEFAQVLNDGKARAAWQVTSAGQQWLIYQGIVFPYTGTTEGLLVARVDLDELLRPLPDELMLASVALQRVAGSENTRLPPDARRAALFKGNAVVAAGPLELLVVDQPSSIWTKLLPLLTAYLLATLLLIVVIVLRTRRDARALIEPLAALRDRAREIAVAKDLSLPIPKAGTDEVGQLADSIASMVAAIRSAEDQQRESEDRFRLIYDRSNEAILFAWPDGRVDAANPAACRLFGYSEAALLALGRAGIMDTTDPRLPVALDERDRTGTFRGELRCRHADGHIFPVEVVSTLFLDAQGTPRTTSMFRDISEQKRAEADLKRYQDVVASMPDAVALFDHDYRYLMVNEAFESIAGIGRARLIGRRIEAHVGRDVFNRHIRPCLDRCLKGEPARFQNWFDFPGIGRRFVSIHYFPSRDADNRINGVVAIGRDITERKQTNDALQASLDSLRLRENALAAISQGVLITGPDKLITYASEAFERITGYAASEVLGQSCALLQGPGSAPETIAAMRAALDAAKPFHGEILNYRKDGSTFWNELSIMPVHDAAGVLIHFVGVQRDVSERKLAALALQANQALIKTVFDSLDEQVVVLDAQGVILVANAAWRRFGMDNGASDEVIEGVGLNYLETCVSAVSPSDVDEGRQARAGIGAVLAGTQEQYCLDYPCHSHYEQRWFHMQVIALQGSRRGAVVIHENITERIESNKRLKALSINLIEVQEAARRHLAGELHDRTSANLAAIIVNMDAATMALGEHDWQGVAERMADNRALVEDTTVSIREICAELRPPALDYAGLVPAVEAYGAQFSRRTGIAVEVNALGRDLTLAPDTESTLFRIVQEALTNVAKHAQAATVDIEICLQGPPLCLNIVDDGRGFDPLKTPARGLGLINMREMAEFAGGSLRIDAAPGRGTRIHVEIPQSARPA